MIRELRVRGLGVLDDVSVTFGPGLNVVSGETGAGKTLLVSSLALLTGARADSRMVAAAGSEALVEAAVDMPSGGELILVRRLGPDGRSRAWVDGVMSPVAALAEAGRGLVEIHGQGDGFALARPRAQLDALDAFAGTLELRRRYESTLAEVRALQAEAERIASEERERERAIDVLSFQVDEIERARLDSQRDNALPLEVSRLEHAERLRETAAHVLARAGSEGAAGLLAEAARMLSDAVRFDPAAAALASRAEGLFAEASDLGSDLRSWSDSLDDDPARLEELRERVALVGRLQKKYGGSVEEILAFARDSAARLEELRGAGARAESLEAEMAALRRNLLETAETLSERRREAAARLSALIREELPALALAKAAFEVRVDPSDEPGEHGADDVRFLFSADASVEPGPLGRIASGGELSRVMVAVTLALASAHAVPSLIFDEADQGVGGAAALELARRLARLGETHQVLVVTHLPQIAAFARTHLVVDKEDGRVTVSECHGEDRVAELARMLSGLGESARGRAHAAELLELAGAETKAELKSKRKASSSVQTVG